jgi:hypothetical protein
MDWAASPATAISESGAAVSDELNLGRRKRLLNSASHRVLFIAQRSPISPPAGKIRPVSSVFHAALQYSAAIWLRVRKESAAIPLTMHEHLAKGRGLHRFAFAA